MSGSNGVRRVLPGAARAVTEAGRALLDLVLPEECGGCGAAGALLCADCGAPLLSRPRLAWPTPAPAGLPPPWAVARYEDPVRGLVVAHKERGARALTRPLGAALAASAAAAWCATGGAEAGGAEAGGAEAGGIEAGGAEARVAQRIVLVPLPSRRAAVRERGRDPTLALAVEAGRVLRRTGVACAVLPGLRLRRGVRDQAGLDATQRAANLSGAVRLRGGARRLLDGPWAGAPVLLVDDVITTGASLCAAADLLRAHGVAVPACAVVAATPRAARGTAHQPPLG